jgi:hypothetical protein
MNHDIMKALDTHNESPKIIVVLLHQVEEPHKGVMPVL